MMGPGTGYSVIVTAFPVSGLIAGLIFNAYIPWQTGASRSLARLLRRSEFLYATGVRGRPETLYARSGEAHLAFQVTGEGPVELVLTPGFISHLDLQWESVTYRRFVRQLTAFARVIRYDKRGTGLSDPVPAVPTLEQRAEDL